MKSADIRKTFLDFFAERQHQIVPSAPMVVKNDPTLMFVNAGMNQFKDIFLGNRPVVFPRVADTQKCLRVSGKHNDLEEVGHDTYHHTMFEMLGNWSFGDYFKEEAIAWAWELLTEVFKIDGSRLYVTVFQGDDADYLPPDQESYKIWQHYQTEEKILFGGKKDNFWEMGDTGPCGPCSEIHIDVRSGEERNAVPGYTLVNKGHPKVIEIWNLVFIEFNRMANGQLQQLPARHVDTGMGLERLCMVLQGKQSNYDTDVFQPIIREIEKLSGKYYGSDPRIDVAMRVIADHLRAVAFAIADGQLPSNNKAGYVIRRILRRAVRYGYNFLGFRQPFMVSLVPILRDQMGSFFPELIAHESLISNVMAEEEANFLRTLESGIQKFNSYISNNQSKGIIDGNFAFELYDTFGFPVDLTRLILKEQGLDLDDKGFENEMKEQKDRSREDASVEAAEWTVIRDIEGTVFTGYESTEEEVVVTRYRKVKQKSRYLYHIIFDKTPFYAESGGQVGDSGMIKSGSETIMITDTVKENNLIIHIAEKIMHDPSATFTATVDTVKRTATACNHTATHLLHHALRKVLGSHVEQKGSLVNPERLRFDFSHFGKPSKEELLKVEMIANGLVRENHHSKVIDGISMKEAQKMGAIALFGEKYGEKVRVVQFGDSVELCGGTHVDSTASIGIIKIVSEGAIAAGVRRIEAVTAAKAEEYINEKLSVTEDIASLLNNPKDLKASIEKLISENSNLRKTIEKLEARDAMNALKELEDKAVMINDIRFISGRIETDNPDLLKTIAFEIRKRSEDSILVLGSESAGKAVLVVMISDKLVKEKNLDAVRLIKEISGEINGGGGGQPFLATAGGRNPAGIGNALKKAEEYVRKI